jgi:uncharacterized membrane protein
MTQATSVTATFLSTNRPDALLSLGNGAFVGNGIYNTTGAGQTVALPQTRGTTRTFRIRVQNDGAVAEAFMISGPGSSSGFQVTYSMGSTDVTSRAFRTAVLAPGGMATITLSVKVQTGAPIGRVKSILVTSASTALASAKDAVLATITVA